MLSESLSGGGRCHCMHPKEWSPFYRRCSDWEQPCSSVTRCRTGHLNRGSEAPGGGCLKPWEAWCVPSSHLLKSLEVRTHGIDLGTPQFSLGLLVAPRVSLWLPESARPILKGTNNYGQKQDQGPTRRLRQIGRSCL